MTVRILLGLLAGLLIGLFFGEHALALQPLADIYIRLLQMTVLPYLIVGLVLGIGRLDPGESGHLFRYGAVGLLLIWAVALVTVVVMPLAFPAAESASFFSSALVEPRGNLGLTDLLVPANPFYALANSLVPAVTLFSACVGVALMGVPEKERLLAPLDTVMSAIERVTGFVVRLAPWGVVPIVAVAAGTLSMAQLQRLEVYVLAFTVAAVLLGLVLLPLLVSSVTPFRFGEILWASRDALLTAFLTSSVFVVLPMLAKEAKVLARRHGIHADHRDRIPDLLVPIAFNFPTAGKLLTLLFVPFAAWLSGEALAAGSYPRLVGAGLLSYFAKAQVALPFLLDVVGVPHDLFQLYIPSAVVTGKLDSAVGAMSLLAFTLLAVAATAGRATFSAARLLRLAGTAAALLALTVLGTRVVLGTIVDTRYTRDEAVRRMHLPRGAVPPLLSGDSLRRAATTPAGPSTLARVRARGLLRVGFVPNRLPLTFVNGAGEAVGFDVEMATQLAQDLGVRLEMVTLRLEQADTMLAEGVVDVVPSLRTTHHWVRRVRLSEPYLDGTIGLIVPDARRTEFDSIDIVRAHDSLRIGLVSDPDLFEDYVREIAGPVPYRIIRLPADPDSVLGRPWTDLDAVLLLAEVGTAWTLLHPAYTVVVPQPDVIRRPLAFATALTAFELGETLDAWVRLQKARGTVDRAYDYWVLGKGAEPPRRRWSFAHDVLGWFKD